ncbi:hypothetical protein [Tractidigestivibacter montrealensis]|uniref:Pua-like domain-containing protein n=1 Tax=Tractidigestivibacter montrealensis TaxID=2972466 RepID=A0ABT1Z5D3_9ACTN|nr:hypothetical protein [Tractidigestivibacter montrealensis]MCR9035421.1 hypothetical protein [Tractidigestivibacter montrealensis]
MRTVALRFAENFAPDCGTVATHEAVIRKLGYVWYGKLGSAVSAKTAGDILLNDDPRLLLIHSGGQDRWWCHIDAIKREVPPAEGIPSYYRDKAKDFGCWFRIRRFERAEPDVMSKCRVISSGRILTSASRHSMSPYFIIDYAAK